MTDVSSKLQIKKSIENKIRKQRNKERLILWTLVALSVVIGSSMVSTNPSIQCGIFLTTNGAGQIVVSDNLAEVN